MGGGAASPSPLPLIIQMLNASKATATRLAISTTSAIGSYSSQCQLFKSMTAFRRGACSYEVLALQRGANCRKSNLNVYISNDLVQACANDARNTQAAGLRSGGWSIRLRRARPTDLPGPDQWQTCRTGTIFVLDHSGSLRIFPGLHAK